MSLSDADRRVLRIRALMQTGTWERDRVLLYRRLGREWRCSREAVEQYATQAARFIRLALTSRKSAETFADAVRPLVAPRTVTVERLPDVDAWACRVVDGERCWTWSLSGDETEYEATVFATWITDPKGTDQ